MRHIIISPPTLKSISADTGRIYNIPFLKGKVVSINNGAVNSIVSIDIGGGNIITATISCAAVEELNLKVGSDAYAVIKATNVMVGIDE